DACNATTQEAHDASLQNLERIAEISSIKGFVLRN
ncbi:MAG: hypothetical protein ACI9BN_001047, partial [Francisella sp.]